MVVAEVSGKQCAEGVKLSPACKFVDTGIEFSKLRLQYSHDWLEEMSGLTFLFPGREVDSVFFQFEFILGAHGAHKF